MRGSDQVTQEIIMIMDHSGLNPHETLTVETSHSGYRFTSWIRGVDLDLAKAALTRYLLGRPWVKLEVEGDALVLVQWDRP